MPQISNFFGIIIRMFYDEHNPPHFHAQYGEYRCCIDIQTLGVIEGAIPARALGLVVEWAILHKSELLENWERIENQQSINKIEPLN
jgi:phosphomannomutase